VSGLSESVTGLNVSVVEPGSCFSAEHEVGKRHWLLEVVAIQAVETKNSQCLDCKPSGTKQERRMARVVSNELPNHWTI
jgi:hypothetical protein